MIRNAFASPLMKPALYLSMSLILAWFVAAPVASQEAETASQTPAVPTALTEEQTGKLAALRDAIPEQRAKISSLEARVEREEGLTSEILNIRLDLAWLGLLEANLALAEAVVDLEGNGFDVSGYSGDVIDALDAQLSIAQEAIGRTRLSVKLPSPDQSATEQAAAYAKLFEALNIINRIYDVFTKSIEVSNRAGLDTSQSEKLLRQGLNDRAISTSVFLEMSARDARSLRAALAVAPDDAEVISRLAGAERLVKSTANELDRIVRRMDALGLDTTEYRAQILAATGEITTDLFDFSVIGGILSKWWQGTLNVIITEGPTLLFKLLLFIFIIYIARKFALVVEALVKRALSSAHVQISRLLERMILSTISNVVLIIGILIALSQLGISLGPLLAGLGIAGFVIGFALQDTLSNFASGMMILFYRPFDVGDLIEAGGVLGKVSHMSLVNTTVLTIDNQTVIVPNNMIWQGMIKNVTGQNRRRVDLVFGVSYGDDISKVEKVLRDIVESHDKILDDPEPQIHLHELADSSINFIVRPWVKTDDYWDVYWDLMRTVKIRFDEEGISIPFPQRDVHHYSEQPAKQAD